MATIRSINLTPVDKDTIKVNIVRSMGVNEIFVKYRITTNSDFTDTSENTANVNYEITKDDTVYVYVTLHYKVTSSSTAWVRESSPTTDYEIAKHTSKLGEDYLHKEISSDKRVVYVLDTYEEGYYIYYPYYENKEQVENLTDKELMETAIFYQYPNIDFTFNNCASGNHWQYNQGISSLIDNITKFLDYATRWKKWKSQSDDVGTCPSFFNTNNILTAEQLNKVHTYIGTEKSYSKGQFMTANMLNSLTDFMLS